MDLDLKIALIKRQPCFSLLSDNEIMEFADLFKEKQVAAGETIVTEGEEVDSVYLIVDGQADVQHITYQDQVPHVESLAKLGPNQAIGLDEGGFYSLSGRRTATVVAITEMTLLALSVAAFHGFALIHPHVNKAMREYATTFLGMK